jgi:RIO kinase 1
VGIENQKRKIIFSWVQREYRNLLLAREKIKVPTPLGFKDNILMMEFIGDETPASMVKDSFPDNPEEFFKQVVKNIKKLIDAGLVHGDLSDFNILNYNESPVFIDMSQSTLIKTPGARELLQRDLKNVINVFRRNVKIDEEKVLKDVLGYFDKKTSDKKRISS